MTQPGVRKGLKYLIEKPITTAPSASGNGMSVADPGGCGPMPWLPGAVSMAITNGVQRGIIDPVPLAAYVLRRVYPVTTEGRRITWPPRPGAPAAIQCLFARMMLRVHRVLATLADEAADRT